MLAVMLVMRCRDAGVPNVDRVAFLIRSYTHSHTSRFREKMMNFCRIFPIVFLIFFVVESRQESDRCSRKFES
jgi:hypothetical protein